MFLRFEATLNNNKFSDIAEEIVLRDIVEETVTTDVITSRWANRPGQRRASATRTALSVRLVYNIRTQDIVRRAKIRDLVAQWSRDGGYLAVNYRPGMRLLVLCDNPPALDSSLKWVPDLTLTLTAYAIPYWVDETEQTFRMMLMQAGSRYFATDSFMFSGTAEEMPATKITVTNASTIQGQAMTKVKLTTINSSFNTSNPHSKFGAKTMVELNGMSIAPGESVVLSHDATGILSITGGSAGESIMYARTAQSDDDLLVYPGASTQFSAEADTMATVAVETNGWWV